MPRKFIEPKLLIASANKGKIREIKELLAHYKIEIVSTQDFNFVEPEETGTKFIENAELKSRYYGELTGLPALADDSGICIDELGGAPGVYSADWSGETRDFNIAEQKVCRLLQEKGKDTGTARYICVLSLRWPDGHIENFEGKIEGKVMFPPRGNNGFGYDPIFVPEGYDQTMAELDSATKNNISHRADAFRKLISGCFEQ